MLKSAAPQLRESGIEIKIVDETGNVSAISALGTEAADVALITRPSTIEEQAAFPERSFVEVQIGTHAAALLVPRNVWESGVRGVKREQAAGLYEGRITNWKELGGDDREVKFFEIAHGLGLWEMFAGWVYGDLRKAPLVPWEVVNDGADAANAVQFNSGAITVGPPSRADRREIFALALIDEKGVAVEPMPEQVAAGAYTLARPVYALFGSKPLGNKRKVLEFLLSEKGQAVIAASDLLPLTKKPSAEEQPTKRD
jgi:phosphate transport system substrate-binding protein